ncbi:MAG: hypothetical protein ACFFAO_20865 [Candidatus Hermodarchaeota archaeon]
MEFKITDDSGLMALIDPDTYKSFISEDWDYYILLDHFIAQMKLKRMLIWRTGREGIWNVKISKKLTDYKGFREIIGQLKVNKRLCLINYEDLTTGAQFKDYTLPLKHNKDLVFSLEKGNYRVRIVQVKNPEDWDNKSEFDFVIEFEKKEKYQNEWNKIPWDK